MNKRDRDFVDGLDRVLATIASLTPQNPADINAISHNHRIAVAAAKDAHFAASLYRGGEVEWAMDELEKANATLAKEPQPSRVTT